MTCKHPHITFKIQIERWADGAISESAGLPIEPLAILHRNAVAKIAVRVLCHDCNFTGDYNAYSLAWVESLRYGSENGARFPKWLKAHLQLAATTSAILREALVACGVIPSTSQESHP